MNLENLKSTVEKIKALDTTPERKRDLLSVVRRKYLKPLARINPWAFAEYCVTDDKGRFLRLQKFHKEWLNIYKNEQKVLIESPTGTGKSQITSIVWPLYKLGIAPETTILLGMKTAKQARKSMRACMSYISQSKELHEIFPDLRPMPDPQRPWQEMQWSKRDGFIIKRPSYIKDLSMEPIGTDTNTSGNRCKLLILDNMLDDNNTRSREACQKVIEWYESVAESRLFKDSQIICIDTPWTNWDLLAYLSKRPEFYARKYSMDKADKDSDDYVYIEWKEQFDEERLQMEKRNKPDTYKRQRRSRALLDTDKEFETSKIRVEDIDTSSWVRYIGVDLSTKKRRGTCIITISISPDNQHKCVEDVVFGQWSAPDRADKINEVFLMYNPVKTLVEDNALQDDVIDWMNAAGYKHMRIEGVTTTGNNKWAYIDSRVVEVRNGIWIFKAPEHCINNGNLRLDLDSTHCAWCRFINEIADYPNAATNDGLMAWIIANAGTKIDSGFRVHSADLQDKKIKKIFDKSSYRCYNEISRNRGFEPPEQYEEIVDAIKNDKDLSIFDKNSVKLVQEDIKEFVRIINEQW